MSAAASTGSPVQRRPSGPKSSSHSEGMKHPDDTGAQFDQASTYSLGQYYQDLVLTLLNLYSTRLRPFP